MIFSKNVFPVQGKYVDLCNYICYMKISGESLTEHHYKKVSVPNDLMDSLREAFIGDLLSPILITKAKMSKL